MPFEKQVMKQDDNKNSISGLISKLKSTEMPEKEEKDECSCMKAKGKSKKQKKTK